MYSVIEVHLAVKKKQKKCLVMQEAITVYCVEMKNISLLIILKKKSY